MPKIKDSVRLQHMLEAAHQALRLTEGETRQSLDSDIKLKLALTKTLELIGEAAAQVSQTQRESMADVPWAKIVRMRNRLIHGYFEIDHDLVWETATRNVPTLIQQLKTVLKQHPSQQQRNLSHPTHRPHKKSKLKP